MSRLCLIPTHHVAALTRPKTSSITPLSKPIGVIILAQETRPSLLLVPATPTLVNPAPAAPTQEYDLGMWRD